jgi:hypothetical protein
MSVRPGTGREKVLNDWYRQHVKEQIPGLVGKWEPLMGVSVADWGVKRMKTRWGSCNTQARRIWLNSELAKKPPGCLEYVLVHEMAHLLERGHGDGFKSLMDCFLPAWRLRQADLDSHPLAQEAWWHSEFTAGRLVACRAAASASDPSSTPLFDFGRTPTRAHPDGPRRYLPSSSPRVPRDCRSGWYQSGIKKTAAVRWDAAPFRLFGVDKPNRESRRADSNRLPLLITSDPSGVAGACTGLHRLANPAYLRDFLSSGLP